MDSRRFDSLARSLARGVSRRSVLRGLLGLGGAAVAATVVEETVEARTLSLTRIPTPPPPACPSGQQLCGANCCPYGRCFDGLCCPDVSTSRCGATCCSSGDCTSTGVCCTDSDETPCGAICCTTGTCTRNGITDQCCTDGFVCGLECCSDQSLCCDGECCPSGSFCVTRKYPESAGVEEEVCCWIANECPSDPARCCADGEECCATEGCCDGVCYGAAGLCCALPGALCGPDLCCTGEQRCCTSATGPVANFCIADVENSCCDESDCEHLDDPQHCAIGVCNPETHLCQAATTCHGLESVCCPGSAAGVAGVCLDPNFECCTDADCPDACHPCDLVSHVCMEGCPEPYHCCESDDPENMRCIVNGQCCSIDDCPAGDCWACVEGICTSDTSLCIGDCGVCENGVCKPDSSLCSGCQVCIFDIDPDSPTHRQNLCRDSNNLCDLADPVCCDGVCQQCCITEHCTGRIQGGDDECVKCENGDCAFYHGVSCTDTSGNAGTCAFGVCDLCGVAGEACVSSENCCDEDCTGFDYCSCSPVSGGCTDEFDCCNVNNYCYAGSCLACLPEGAPCIDGDTCCAGSCNGSGDGTCYFS